jgi:hypothetical protein
MKKAVEHVFTGDTILTTDGYDATKTIIGSLFKQYTGATTLDEYVTVPPPTMINMVEVTLSSYFCPHVYQWSPTIFWIFAGTNATAAVTRTIAMFTYNSSTNTISWNGFITLSGTTFAGAKTIRSLRTDVSMHTDGTVSTSGTSSTITGSNTLFTSDRIAAGARIGFGTTDPTLVSSWYDISAIASNTSLTISGSVNLPGATAYVIEEIRLGVVCTNATLYNGGIHLIKGLNPGVFQIGGTTIVEATNTDNLRASYLLKDKAPVTVTVTIASPGVFTAVGHGYIIGDVVMFSTTGALPTGLTVNTAYYVLTVPTSDTFTVSATLGGAAVNTSVSQSGVHTLYSGLMANAIGLTDDGNGTATSHDEYLLNLDNTTSVRAHRFNMRAALTVVTGYATGAWSYKTAIQTVTGTVQQVNNGRICTPTLGPAAGVKALFFVTLTRVYRCPISSITDGGGAWLADSMVENPPGSTTTNLATSAFLQIDYSDSIGKFLISTTLAGRHGTYTCNYDPSNPQFEKIFGQINNRTKLTTTNSGAVDALFSTAALSIWTEGGRMFAMPNVTTTGLNWFLVLNIGADGYYADNSNQRVITPKLSTLGASALYRAYMATNQYVGDFLLGYTPEPIRMYYRTSGIDDNSGSWTETINGDLTGASPSDYIQFMFTFEVLGEFCVPRRLYSVTCVYEDASTDTQDSHYLSCADLSSKVTKTFAWKHAIAFGSAVPTLKIRLYNAITNGILDTDDSVTRTGTWEKTTDGGSNWTTYNTTDKGNETTFIRFTPASIPDNVQVKALLTLN